VAGFLFVWKVCEESWEEIDCDVT